MALSPQPSITLVAMKGPPGAGKSTVARALSRELGWPLIDKDDVKDILDGQTPLAGALAYEVMQRIARRQLSRGLSVICDSPLLERSYDRLRQIAAEEAVPLIVVECSCSDEAAWRARIEARQTLGLPSHHTVTWEAVQAFLAKSEATYPIAEPHHVVDTARLLPEIVNDIVSWLSGQPSPPFPPPAPWVPGPQR
jgi:predicted kinase